MTVYPDTSILMSALAEDRHSLRAALWLAGRPRLLISTWTLAELSAVLAIRQRQGALSAVEVERAERQMDVITSDPGSLEGVIPRDVVQARGLVRASENLRAPDALHLAIAMRLRLPMVTFDDNLRDAAVAAGCPVVDL